MARPSGLAIICLVPVLGAAATLVAYWPGVMIDDARWQYQQAVDNAYENWHPPLMAWIWHQLMALMPGPGPMLVLQVLLYWFGIALIACSAYKRGHPWLALALACAGYLPASFALAGSVTKDALMAAVLLVASGMLLLRPVVRTLLAAALLRSGAIVALLGASALRFNAVFACVPLALAALPGSWTCTKPRALACSILAAGTFLMTGPAVSSMLHAEDTDVQLSLMIFDLGGVTERTGVSQFPDLDVRDPVAVNHRCYDPYEWDSYSDWAKNICPLGFDALQSRIDGEDLDARALWLRAIAAHPLAYLEHRLTHFNLSTWFLVPSGPDFTAWSQSVENPWGFRVGQNQLLSAISSVADLAAKTPVGWPIFWISVAFAALVAGIICDLPPEPVAIAAAAFAYGAGYLVVGVATGIRYYMWTFSGAAIAGLLVSAELWRRRARLDRKILLLEGSLVGVPTFLAIAARLTLT